METSDTPSEPGDKWEVIRVSFGDDESHGLVGVVTFSYRPNPAIWADVTLTRAGKLIAFNIRDRAWFEPTPAINSTVWHAAPVEAMTTMAAHALHKESARRAGIKFPDPRRKRGPEGRSDVDLACFVVKRREWHDAGRAAAAFAESEGITPTAVRDVLSKAVGRDLWVRGGSGKVGHPTPLARRLAVVAGHTDDPILRAALLEGPEFTDMEWLTYQSRPLGPAD